MGTLGGKEVVQELILVAVDDAGSHIDDDVGRNLAVQRSMLLSLPDGAYLGDIALTDVPEDVVYLVQETTQCLARHSIVRVVAIVNEVDVRQRVNSLYDVHVGHGKTCLVSFDEFDRAHLISIAHTYPLLENVGLDVGLAFIVEQGFVAEVADILELDTVALHLFARSAREA